MPKKAKKTNYYTFESYCKALKGLASYKDLSEEEFRNKAIHAYIEKYGIDELRKYVPDYNVIKEEINIVGTWKTAEEAKEALDLYNGYCKNRDFTDISDSSLLKQLVFIEIKLRRIQRDTEDEGYRGYIELSNQALNLKRVLGLLSEGEKDDVAQTLKALFAKGKIWREKNRVAFESTCEWCGKMNLHRIRVDKYDTFKHPFFKDKVLCNQPLWDLYKKEGKITKLDVARVLFSDKAVQEEYYVSWLEEKLYSLQEKQQENQNNEESSKDSK